MRRGAGRRAAGARGQHQAGREPGAAGGAEAEQAARGEAGVGRRASAWMGAEVRPRAGGTYSPPSLVFLLLQQASMVGAGGRA
jgi:hypothetical protein